MKIHEYQAKNLLAHYGVVIPRSHTVTTHAEAYAAAKELGGNVVIKAQIHAGGRGKAGGVVLIDSPLRASEVAEGLLGKSLVTHQTGPRGQIVRKLLVEQTLAIDRELYAGLVLDRAQARIVLMMSAEGGVEIEQVAKQSPEKIVQVNINPITGLMPYQVRELTFGLGFTKLQVTQAISFLINMYRAFVDLDASLLEINPLVVTKAGELVALDVKANFDDNALFRHEDLTIMQDVEQMEPAEVEASKYSLNYVRLNGKIGCLVNGAGLAMATMDLIKLYGGEPANFLDVGGGTDVRRVKQGFKLILSHPNVEAMLVNIFGGIVRCDVIAEGIVAGASEINVKIPLVVRLQGTNNALGKRILESSHLQILVAETMQEAAEAVVASVRRET